MTLSTVGREVNRVILRDFQSQELVVKVCTLDWREENNLQNQSRIQDRTCPLGSYSDWIHVSHFQTEIQIRALSNVAAAFAQGGLMGGSGAFQFAFRSAICNEAVHDNVDDSILAKGYTG